MVCIEYLLAHSPRILGTEEGLCLVEGYVRSLVDQGIVEEDYVRGRASESSLNETDDHLKKIAEENMEKNFLDTCFVRAKVLDSSRMGTALTKMVESLADNPHIIIDTYTVNNTPTEPPSQ
jgi:hypothetical protein